MREQRALRARYEQGVISLLIAYVMIRFSLRREKGSEVPPFVMLLDTRLKSVLQRENMPIDFVQLETFVQLW